MNFDDPQELASAAGEYVLGTLDEVERLEVAREALSNPAMAREIAAWQDRLLPLATHAAPADPSEGLWERIDATLPPARSPQLAQAANPRQPARTDAAADEPFWRRARVWQGITGLAVAACLALAVALVGQRAGLPEARYVAVLQSPDKVAGWIVETSAQSPLRLVPLMAGATVPEGKSLQFWTKLDGAAGPTSLGLVQAGQSAQVERARLPGVAGNQLFEITLEPPNGSPYDKPSGPILYVGRSVPLS